MTAMRIGYARVSTADQHLDLQQDALRQAGCEKIMVDRVSGTVADRPGLAKVRDMLRPGDMLVVWRLDRLGRSIKDLIEWVTSLEHAQAPKSALLLVSRNLSMHPCDCSGALVGRLAGS